MVEAKPRNFHMESKWLLRIDGIERVRFSRVSIPDEMVTDIISKKSGELYPNRAPGEYQPIDIEVIAASFADTTVNDLWNRTIEIIKRGDKISDDLYFDAVLVQLDRDGKTETTQYILHKCYVGGRKFGDFDAESDGARKVGFVLRPNHIEEIPIT